MVPASACELFAPGIYFNILILADQGLRIRQLPVSKPKSESRRFCYGSRRVLVFGERPWRIRLLIFLIRPRCSSKIRTKDGVDRVQRFTPTARRRASLLKAVSPRFSPRVGQRRWFSRHRDGRLDGLCNRDTVWGVGFFSYTRWFGHQL